MNIPVLSDFSKSISKSYGVLLDGLGAALRSATSLDDKVEKFLRWSVWL